MVEKKNKKIKLKLSEREEKLILQDRQRQKQPTVIKTGTLKHDLYRIKKDLQYSLSIDMPLDEYHKIIDSLKDNLKVIAKKGEKFECTSHVGHYIDKNTNLYGEYYQWQPVDQKKYIVFKSEEVAENHLTNIKRV